MEHKQSDIKVLVSSNYSQFHMIKGNRSLDMNKIKKILADIERGTNLLKYCPILVVENGGKLEIKDGQHRFTVAKKIKSPIYYILAENMSLYDIAKMNSNQEKWKAKDFINCYKELGNKHYIALEAFMKQYPGLTVTAAISLLQLGKVHAGGLNGHMDKFHRGEFEVKHQKQADMIMEKVNRFEFHDRFSRAFMQAVAKVIDAGVYPIDELAQKVNDIIALLQKHDHWRKYLTNMEEIANKGKQKRVAIY